MSVGRGLSGGRKPARLLRREDGQSLLEFAIVVPILLALLIGIFEFGRAWNIQQVITNVAREGARRGVISTATDTEVRAKIDTLLMTARLDPAVAAVTTDNVAGLTGTAVTIRIDYPYTFLFMGPVVRLISGGAWPGSITLSSTSIMRNE